MSNTRYFTHLHLHTDYSLLDGAITLDKLIAYGKKYGCKALAISDHGNIFAAVKFFEKCKKAGMKPVLGIEAYFSDDRKVKNSSQKYYHQLLLVQNEIGYKNLCKLISHSYTDGFYFKPRIDYQLLEQYNEGLIATSTCLGGHVPQLLLQERLDDAVSTIQRMQNIFEDRYYLEVQPADQNEQKIVNQKLFDLADELHVPVFASGDCHYALADDRYAHEVMLAVQTRHLMTDQKRMTFGDCRAHMRSPEEMIAAFPDREEVVWRTGQIADRCNFEFQTGKLFFPRFDLPAGEDDDAQFFIKECIAGLDVLRDNKRIPLDQYSVYKERLDFECQMIIKMGFVTYLLIVSDFIRWAKKQKIAVGPGRGSAAGSLVAWVLDITDIDPLKYNLLFERFLNPERVSMPDIDVDFCILGREKVINYVKDRYGHDRVGQIITFGTMMAKGVVKDVARALGFSFEDANAITELIPDELKISLKDAIDQQPKLRTMIEQNNRVAELFDIAQRLEGITRHASKHAAGIVISPEPIADVLPIYIPPKTGDVVTQYAMSELESLGFLKMDFLGLKNLTLITDVLNYIHRKGIALDIQYIPLDDQKTFHLLSSGATSGVFQLESDGLKDVLRRLKPQSFEDIIAVNALYRPGPLGSGMVDDFIERRHGRQKITYIFPELEPVLKETYGVIVYQEQVMRIASVIGGYSLGEADILRRAMGKKKADVMAEQKAIFVNRAQEKGFDLKKSDELFELMAYFAGYGFNKSHSAAYALIAYQTAYLKANYPVEFLSVLISLETGNPDSFVLYLQEARAMGVVLLPPDINKSYLCFEPEGEAIRYGLMGVKNVGHTALESILNARKEGDFKNLYDLCKRIDLRVCNKRVIEYLIMSGALDSLPGNRAEKLSNVDVVIDCAQAAQDKARTGQMGLFDVVASGSEKQDDAYPWVPCAEFTTAHFLEREKEALGVYLSKHPLDEYKAIKKIVGAQSLKEISLLPSQNVIAMATISSFREIVTKKGDNMAFCIVEDLNHTAELVVFPKIYKKYEQLIKKESLLLIMGDASESSSQQVKIKVEALINIHNFDINANIQEVIIMNVRPQLLDQLKLLSNILQDGFVKLNFQIIDEDVLYRYKVTQKIILNNDLIDWIEKNNLSVKAIFK